MSTQVEFAVAQSQKASNQNEYLEREKKNLFDKCFAAE